MLQYQIVQTPQAMSSYSPFAMQPPQVTVKSSSTLSHLNREEKSAGFSYNPPGFYNLQGHDSFKVPQNVQLSTSGQNIGLDQCSWPKFS